jgi:hypothetical protein
MSARTFPLHSIHGKQLALSLESILSLRLVEHHTMGGDGTWTNMAKPAPPILFFAPVAERQTR